MATAHDYPVRVNSTAATISSDGGDVLITAILKAGDIAIDGGNTITFAGPLTLDSPIICNTFTAEIGMVAYSAPAANWSPANTDQIAVYDFSDASTITANISDEVITVADKSGNGHTLTTTVAGTAGADSRLVTGADTLNGRNVLSLTRGGPTYLQADNIVLPTDGSSMSLMVAQATDVTSLTASLISWTATGGDVAAAQTSQFSSFNNAYFRGNWITQSMGATPISLTDVDRSGPSIYTLVGDRTGVDTGVARKYISIDGTLPPVAANSNPDTYTNSPLTPARLKLFTARTRTVAMGCICGEVLILGTVAKGARQAAECYLAHKWSLAGNLPTSHPFKD